MSVTPRRSRAREGVTPHPRPSPAASALLSVSTDLPVGGGSRGGFLQYVASMSGSSPSAPCVPGSPTRGRCQRSSRRGWVGSVAWVPRLSPPSACHLSVCPSVLYWQTSSTGEDVGASRMSHIVAGSAVWGSKLAPVCKSWKLACPALIHFTHAQGK